VSVLCNLRKGRLQEGEELAKEDRRKDGYPTVRKALSAVADELTEEDQPIIRATVQMLASGEVTYTIHRRGDEEGQGGYLPPPDQAPARTGTKS
jgi:hypothetical protein